MRTRRPAFKFELLPLYSPLLGQSLLVSFPPLIDMLKFSGYPYLIRGQPEKIKVLRQWSLPRLIRRFDLTLLRPKLVRPRRGLRGTPALRRTGAQYQAVLEWCNDARTGMPLGIPRGAMCVQRFDDSLNSAIHITYRISLRSSSMREPRDPLLKVVTYIRYTHVTFEDRCKYEKGRAAWTARRG